MARGSIEKYEGKQGHSWRLRVVTGYDDRGKPIVKRHTVKGVTKREAEAKLRELLTEVDKGTYVEPSKINVEEFMKRWFDTHKHIIALSTQHRYRGDIFCHIIPRLGKILLQKLTTLQVQGFANELLQSGFKGNANGKGLSPKSVRNCVRLLRQALDQAIEWGLLHRNPVKGVKSPRVTRKEMHIITEKQAAMLLKNLEGTYAWLPTLIAYHTGMRRGEILALTWDCVDLENKCLIIKSTYGLHDQNGPLFKAPKTRAGLRKVDIGETLVEALKLHRSKQLEAERAAGNEWNNRHNLVCTKENGDFINPKAITELFGYRAKGIGLNLTFHGLRHTHVSMLIKAGVPINVISARIGHSSPSITHDVYAHLMPGMSRDAADRFEQLLTESLTQR